MWDQIFKRWTDLVFWWLPKHQAAEPPAQRTAEPAAKSTPARPPQAAAPAAEDAPKGAQASLQGQAAPPRPAASAPVPDDLTVIKGIGPVVQQKLRALGIRTFDDLAAADPATLAGQLKGRQPISPALVRGWTEAAERRVTTRH
jgi:predicted flap endonuclease-1-like 5' DNA nuclease